MAGLVLAIHVLPYLAAWALGYITACVARAQYVGVTSIFRPERISARVY